MNLTDWLTEKQPQQGDEAEFTLDGEEYRAFIDCEQGYLVLRVISDTWKCINLMNAEQIGITKLTLLRPSKELEFFSHVWTYMAPHKGHFAKRTYAVVGTWEKEAEKKCPHGFSLRKCCEQHAEGICNLCSLEITEQRMREIAREEASNVLMASQCRLVPK